MASTNKTTNLQLSQYLAADKPTWLDDYNSDMKTIDAAVGRAAKVDSGNTFSGTQIFSEASVFSRGVEFDQHNSDVKISKFNDSLMYFSCGSTSNAGLYLGRRESQWSLSPQASNGLHLGHPNYKWADIYGSNGIIQTSDKHSKKDIESLDDSFVVAMVENLRPVSYKMKEGTSGRTHVGFIAQEVEEVLAKVGKTNMDFAGLIKSPKTEEYKEKDVDGNDVVKYREVAGEFIYGLRYEEFISLICRYTQIKATAQDTLAKELATLKAQVAELTKAK